LPTKIKKVLIVIVETVRESTCNLYQLNTKPETAQQIGHDQPQEFYVMQEVRKL